MEHTHKKLDLELCDLRTKLSQMGDMRQELQTRFFQINIHSVHVYVVLDSDAGAVNIMFAQTPERLFELRSASR